MQVSPVDIQAWASETGAEYPSTPAEKAAVLPAVAAWKREQLADAQAARGQNALATPLMVLGGVGLGLGGLAIYQHLRKQGHSHDSAVAAAKTAEGGSDIGTRTPPPPPPGGPSGPSGRAPSPGGPAAPGPQPQGPSPQRPPAPSGPPAAPAPEPTRVTAAAAAEPQPQAGGRAARPTKGVLTGANRSGTLQARFRGDYNNRSIWTDPELGPLLAQATTPELQEQLVQSLAGNPARALAVKQALEIANDERVPIINISSIEELPSAESVPDGTAYRLGDTGDVVVANRQPVKRDPRYPRGWQSGSTSGVRFRLAPTNKDAYGTDTLAENEALQLSKVKRKPTLQPGYYPDNAIYSDDGTELFSEELGRLRMDDPVHRSAAGQMLLADRLARVKKANPGITSEEALAAANLIGGTRIAESNTQPMQKLPYTGRVAIPKRDVNGDIVRLGDGKIVQLTRSPRLLTSQALVDGVLTTMQAPPEGFTSAQWTKPRPVFGYKNSNADEIRLDQVFSDKEDGSTQGLMEPLPASRGSYASGWVVDKLDLGDYAHNNNGVAQPLTTTTTYKEVTTPGGNIIQIPTSTIDGLWVETPRTTFVPNGRTRTKWDPSTESYIQVPLGQRKPVLSLDGQIITDYDERPAGSSIVYDRRPAKPQDLWTYSWAGDTAPPYLGKTAAEAATAMPALPYDYSRAEHTVKTFDGKTHRVPAFQQNRFILAEIDDSYSKALTAGDLIAKGADPAKTLSLYGTDLPTVNRALAYRNGTLAMPSTRTGPWKSVDSVGGHTSEDWLSQVLSSMQLAGRPGAHRLAELQNSTTRESSAEIARGWLNANPGIAETLASNFSNIRVDEQLNVVQEALGQAAEDWPKAIAWGQVNMPEVAARAQLDGEGRFGFEQFQKSYVRKAVLGAAAELNNAGGGQAASVTIPAHVSELLMLEARRANPHAPKLEEAINARVAGATTPVEALWKLDGILSDAASDKLTEGYTNGSRLAEGFFAAAQPGDGSHVGAMKQRFGARVDSAYNSTAAPGRQEQPASRLPLAINFGTTVSAGEGSSFNPNDTRSAKEAAIRAVVAGNVTTSSDPSVINPDLPKSRKEQSFLTQKTGGSSRAFAVNKVLENKVKALQGSRHQLKDDLAAGDITKEEHDLKVRKINAAVRRVIRDQNMLDNVRAGNEILIGEANRGVIGTGEGRGYVLDLGDNGVVRALPDTGSSVFSYESLFDTREGENDEYFSREQLRESQMAEGDATTPYADTSGTLYEPVASDPNSGVLRALKEADRESPMSDAEAAGALQHLRYNQAIARLRQQQQQQQKQAIAPPTANPSPLGAAAPEPQRATYAGSGPIGDIQRTVAAQLFPSEELLAARSQALQTARAYRPMANTLAASVQGPAVGYSEQELSDARARHIGDWISKAATPRFNSAGAQIAGWTGGDSWHGGARLAGRANQNIAPYTPASDAMVKALALAARRRAAV